MMKVLHYVENMKQLDLRSDCIKTLIEGEKEYVDIALAKNYTEFVKILAELTPDIVHIHSCWDKTTCRCAKIASKKNIPIALSSYWSLNSFERKKEQPKAKLLKSYLYLVPLIKKIDTFVIDDEQEKEAIIRKGWSKRIGVIKSSILNSDIKAEETAEATIVFYKKIIDSVYQFAMSEQEKDAVKSLLTAGLYKEHYNNPLPVNQTLSLRSLNSEQWKRIFLYADDEGVRDIIDYSIQRLQIDAPAIDTQGITRFPLLKPKSTLTIEEYRGKHSKKLYKKLFKEEDLSCDTMLKDIVIACYYMKLLYKKRAMSLKHLCDLHILLKYNDYDEDRLKELLKKAHLYKFTCCMIKVLQQFTQLEEGFMPLPTLDNRTTRQIDKIFNKRK